MISFMEGSFSYYVTPPLGAAIFYTESMPIFFLPLFFLLPGRRWKRRRMIYVRRRLMIYLEFTNAE